MYMKKTILILSAAAAGMMLFATACSKTSEDIIAPANNCDTSAVSYSADVVPILQNSCYRCHATGSTGGSGGINLDSYTNLKKWADNGFLAGDITHAPGYIPMPYDGGTLTDCEINKITAWIHQGTKNN